MITVNYDWDEIEDNIVEEYDDAGATIAEYTTEAELFGNVISQRRSGQDSYFHYDGQGSTLALTNANQQISDTYAYSAFGELTFQLGGTDNAVKYVGRHGYYYRMTSDVELSIRRRLLRPSLGRWLSPEPIERAFPSNAYGYVDGNPNRWIDPSGMVPSTTPTYHHWFPDLDGAGNEQKSLLCNGHLAFHINRFTTNMGFQGKDQFPDNAHYWIENRFFYNSKYKVLLLACRLSPAPCCCLMTGVWWLFWETLLFLTDNHVNIPDYHFREYHPPHDIRDDRFRTLWAKACATEANKSVPLTIPWPTKELVAQIMLGGPPAVVNPLSDPVLLRKYFKAKVYRPLEPLPAPIKSGWETSKERFEFTIEAALTGLAVAALLGDDIHGNLENDPVAIEKINQLICTFPK